MEIFAENVDTISQYRKPQRSECDVPNLMKVVALGVCLHITGLCQATETVNLTWLKNPVMGEGICNPTVTDIHVQLHIHPQFPLRVDQYEFIELLC